MNTSWGDGALCTHGMLGEQEVGKATSILCGRCKSQTLIQMRIRIQLQRQVQMWIQIQLKMQIQMWIRRIRFQILI